MLLLCDVLIGNTWTVESAKEDMNLAKLRPKGYDSLFARRDTRKQGGVLYDEYVVYDASQALPRYIIHYQTNDVMSEINLTGKLAPTKKPTKHILTATRTVDTSDPLQMHYRIAESQFLRLLNVTGKKRKIKSIALWSNPALKAKFDAKKQELEQKYASTAECIFGFHGTKSISVDGIMEKNFNIDLIAQNTGNPGQYGAGIYFSETPEVCFGYGDSLILCKVLLGKCLDVTGKAAVKGKPVTAGYDSHGAHPTSHGHYQIIVIFDADHILPCYVIENEAV